MYNLSNLPTTEQFARSLAQVAEEENNPFDNSAQSQLFRAPISYQDISNGTTASNPHNSDFILGVGHSNLPNNRGAFNVRGLNSNRSDASLVFAKVPGQNAVTWMIVKNT